MLGWVSKDGGQVRFDGVKTNLPTLHFTTG